MAKNAPAKPEDVQADIEKVVEECSLPSTEASGRIQRAAVLAQGMQRLKDLISDEFIAQNFQPLQGSRLGFLTDKDDKGGYDTKTVRECLIEALLRGVQPVGNEFNIIAGQPYITKEGFARLVREFPGLTDLRENYGVPKMSDNGARVQCSASWKLNGVEDSLEREFAIKVNRGMGTDAVLGKAKRKLLAAVFDRLTGSEMPEGEVGDAPAASGSTKSEGAASLEAAVQGGCESEPDQTGEESQVEKVVRAFGQYGVSREQIEERIGRSIGEATDDDLQELRAVYQEIRSGNSTVADCFNVGAESAA